jgi:hypothetical protein
MHDALCLGIETERGYDADWNALPLIDRIDDKIE